MSWVGLGEGMKEGEKGAMEEGRKGVDERSIRSFIPQTRYLIYLIYLCICICVSIHPPTQV